MSLDWCEEYSMKPISTRTHGMLDFATAGALCIVPRLLRLDARVTMLLTAAGAGAVAYSLVTKYEYGLMPLLPMKGHLVLDAGSGLSLCAAPIVMGTQDPMARNLLLGMGVWEIAAALMTQTRPQRVGLSS
jgi:hypothetical protein